MSLTTIRDADAPTGLWFEGLTTPYDAFVDAGVAVTLASIDGGAAPIDPRSVKAAGENVASVERFLNDARACDAMKNTLAVNQIDSAGFDAIFLPGGHGTMWDLPLSADLADLLGQAWADGKVVAAVCHGPAGLVGVTDQAGEALVKGRRVTGFSDSEERAAGLDKAVPFLLETRLRELGADCEKAESFQPFAIADGWLVTGQNPASSAMTAELVLMALRG